MIEGGSNSWSSGADMFLSRLSAHGQANGTRAYPDGMDRALVRFQGRETIHAWFGRCVANFMPEGVERWQIEDNLAAFAFVSWTAGELRSASINVLRTDCSLQDYLGLTADDLRSPEWQEFARPQYLRFDLDYGTLGPMGTHPLPHLHFGPDNDAPRWVLDAGDSANVVVDFIDFLYRHWFSRTWTDWARRTWTDHFEGAGRDPERNPFERIVEAFAQNEIDVLHSLSKEVADLAGVLKVAKEQLYDLGMNAADRDLMSFPDWNG